MATEKIVYSLVLLGLNHEVVKHELIFFGNVEGAIVAIQINSLEDAKLLEDVYNRRIKESPEYWFESNIHVSPNLKTVTAGGFAIHIAEFLK